MKDNFVNRIDSSRHSYTTNKTSTALKMSRTFSEVLNAQSEVGVRFSKHASLRIETRELSFSQEEMIRLKNAISRAEQKGVKDALILIDDKAVIANVKSKTVITTFKEIQMKESVVTNIDGAVIG